MKLREFAFNLHWCWSHESIELFRRLDHNLWEVCGHNPVAMLGVRQFMATRRLSYEEASQLASANLVPLAGPLPSR